MKTTISESRKRIALLLILFFLALLFLALRFFWIQVVAGDELAEKALENRMREVTVKAKRGIIYDRNGRKMAISISTDSISANPDAIKKSNKAPQIARQLAGVLGMEEKKVLEMITRDSSFVWVKRQVDFKVSKELRKLDLDGIGFVEESRRYYPNGKLASHILGISGIDNTGLDGLDLYYDSLVGGQDGQILIEYDAMGRQIPEAVHHYIPPVEGSHLVLTIDQTIQYIVERELDKAVQLHQPDAACCIVMDPTNGEILAMASRPDFNPNNYQDYPAENRRNYAVSNAYEPGSTMKIVTASAAMEEGVVSSGDRFSCPGHIMVGKRSISCMNNTAHGSMSFNEVVEKSCNVGFITVGLRLGIEEYFRYLHAFGFGTTTGIDLPGESSGILVPQSRATQLDLATMSMGQANAVTPIQLITAAAAVANKGMMMKPHLLKEVLNSEGKVQKHSEAVEVKQVISAQTAQELSLILEGVVENGSGRNAFIEGYRAAGKTGTAQKISPDGGYLSDEYVSSFLGFAPANEPRLVCLVIMDHPKGYPYYGGWVAAPVFRTVIEDSLAYLNVPRTEIKKDDPGTESTATVSVPDVISLPIDQTVQKISAAGLQVQIQGEGDVVWGQSPKAGASVKPDSLVIVRLSPETGVKSEGEAIVPDLVGRSIKDAARLLSEVGLHLTPDGYGLAYEQNPTPGTRVPSASNIAVRFQPPE